MTACRYTNAVILALAALCLFILPSATTVYDLMDPGIRSPGVPQSAWRIHKNLTPKFERWARERLDSARASKLSTQDISGTEWPLFGVVFYLWGTESLQDEWEKNHGLFPVAPKIYARQAVDSAARLVIDPKQANWVKIHWGQNYLKTENVFYRMLVIAALTSHARLTGDREFLEMLKDQVESLSAELDASAYGWLNDYPNECYPGDVLAAIAMIRKADSVLGTDHSAFVARSIRAFRGRMLDNLGLVPYSASVRQGTPQGGSRGCGNSYASLMAPTIWPEEARKWYGSYVEHFWQNAWTATGFREFPKECSGFDWYLDVDSGPVLKGYGFAACAFGVGAARVNGHFEHAYPLTAEMFAVSCPLPNGSLLIPRILSNAADAPYLGEAGILYILTRQPLAGIPIKTGGQLPGFVVIVLALQLSIGIGLAWASCRSLSNWHRRESVAIRRPRLQLALWVCLIVTALGLLCFGSAGLGMAALVAAQAFPRGVAASMHSHG